MLMDDMLFTDGSEFRLGSIVPNLKFFIASMVVATLITFAVMSYAATRQVTTGESMLMKCKATSICLNNSIKSKQTISLTLTIANSFLYR